MVAVVLLGGVLAARSAGPAEADPALAAARSERVAASARTARDAVAALRDGLETTRDHARRGSALIVEGDQPPADELEAAASELEATLDEAEAVRAAVLELDGLLRAAYPAIPTGPLQAVPTAVELASLAGQLRDAGGAATEFVVRREAAQETLAALEVALRALEESRPGDAVLALDRAEAARARVADWERPPPTLPLWLQTTGALLDAAGDMAAAASAHDQEAYAEASAAYREASAEARRADTALALTLSETAAGLTATPMRRLAEALAATSAATDTVASVLQLAG